MVSVKQLIQNDVNLLKTYKYENIDYYLIDDLMKIKLFSKNCNRSKPNFIKKHGLVDNQMIFGRVCLDDMTITYEASLISKKFSKRFILQSAVLDCLQDNTNMETKQAPPILDNDGFCFFKDKNNIEYNVEMRGERSQDKIYFNLQDVKNVLELPNLQDVVIRSRSSFIAITDYDFFINYNPTSQSDCTHKELYLTYAGLIKCMTVSRIGRGKEFVEYINKVVFAAIAGNQSQRTEVSASILQMQLSAFKKVLSKCAGNVSCLYLLNTGITNNNEKVYKFGFTNDLNRCLNEHKQTFGDKLKLTHFCLISEYKLKEAETEFKNAVAYFNKKLDTMPTQTELLFLNNISKKSIKSILSNISSKFSEDYQLITIGLQAEIMRKDTEIKLLKKDLELKDKEIELLMLKLSIK